MISLLLSIASSTIILILFKLLERFNIKVFYPIVVNYLIASVLGFILSGQHPISVVNEHSNWLLYSAIIGVLLIGNFYIMGNSTQKAGVAVTTVAAKMAFVMPVLFSLLYDINDVFTIKKAAQIVLALIAVFLVVFKGKIVDQKKASRIWLPVVLFIGIGILDSIVKYGQYTFISNELESSKFSALNFSVAGIIGLMLVLAQPKQIAGFKKAKVWVAGSILGIANFGSMYFLINALNQLKINNSLVFGINNIAIILVSILLALLAFKEKFTRINWFGLVLSIIVLISMLLSFA